MAAAKLFLFGILLLANVDNGMIEKHQDQLQDIKKELEDKKETVSKLLEKENSIVRMLDTLDRKIDSSRKRSRTLTKQKEETQKAIREKRLRIATLEHSTHRHREEIASRLRNLNKLGEIGYLRLLFTIKELQDFGEATRVVKRIVRTDLELVDAFESERTLLSKENEALYKQQKHLAEVLRRLGVEKSDIRQQKKRQKSLLSLTRGQKDFFAKSVRELEEAAKNLQRLIDKLATKDFRSNFAVMKGTLRPPVDSPVVGRFGRFQDPKFKTFMNRNGIEFATERNSEVRVIHTGRVIYADWFRGYGKIIIIDHGDGYYSMHAHLSQVHRQTGETVKGGEIIGLTGDTGSLKGPLLYFELRYRGRAIDPLPWFSPLKLKLAQ